MNKTLLLEQIISDLDALHQNAVKAAMQAYKTATHKENVAENKYDTLGLEASYLAQGQARRVDTCAADLAAFKKLKKLLLPHTSVTIGSLIELADEHDTAMFYFMGPGAGGLKLTFCEQEVMVITSSSPLGKTLTGQSEGVEIILKLDDKALHYDLVAVH